MVHIILIILLVSPGGTIDAFVAPDMTSSVQFTDSIEGRKQFLSWARQPVPRDGYTKICVVELAERQAPTNLHAYLTKEREAASKALGTDYTLDFWPQKLMQQAAQFYGANAIDRQFALRVCN